MNTKNDVGTRVLLWLKIALFLSLIVLVWVSSFLAVAHSNILSMGPAELTTILFGASSLALATFSVLVALAAIFGWRSIMGTIREHVEAVTRIRLEGLENELRGRAFSMLGYVTGEMSIDDQSLALKPNNEDRLAEAVEMCQRGYEHLRKVGGAAEYMGLNNLVYYSLALGRGSRATLLSQARLLLREAVAHNARKLSLTACGVILKHSSDEKERQDAREVIEDLLHSGATDREAREARLYLGFKSSQAAAAPPKATRKGVRR